MDRARTLRDVVSAPHISLTPEMQLGGVAALFLEKRVSGAPVVQAGRVVGVVSVVDLLYAVSGRRAARPEEGDRAADGGSTGRAVAREPTPEFFTRYWKEGDDDLLVLLGRDVSEESADERTMAHVMSRPVHALPPDTELSIAADYMLDHHIHRLLVLDDGRLVGVVTTAEMVRAMGGVDR